MPWFVANLRGKLATGEGPFDVDRDAAGVKTELPTGSGFYALEPSLTVIYPTDPVRALRDRGLPVEHRARHRRGDRRRRDRQVDPGDAIRFGFGFSFAVNESTSFSLGYSQDLIDETTTQVDGIWTESEDLTVGNVTFGISHRLNDRHEHRRRHLVRGHRRRHRPQRSASACPMPLPAVLIPAPPWTTSRVGHDPRAQRGVRPADDAAVDQVLQAPAGLRHVARRRELAEVQQIDVEEQLMVDVDAIEAVGDLGVDRRAATAGRSPASSPGRRPRGRAPRRSA